MKNNRKEILTLALGVALLPPLWAVVSGWLGISFGGIALACAGYFGATGNDRAQIKKLCGGLFMGCIWGYMATNLMALLPFSPDINLFTTLFIMGFLCAIIASTLLQKHVALFSWLGSWALALDKLGSYTGAEKIKQFCFLFITMMIGIFYVGIGVEKFQRLLMQWNQKKQGGLLW